MKIAITDANIFIDLIKLEWLVHLLKIKFEIYTSIEILDELNEKQRIIINDFAFNNSITVYAFSEEEIIDIDKIKSPASLTFEDVSIMYLAKKLGADVLSGDALLKKFCLKNNLEVKGIIWLFDKFVELDIITKQDAVLKMKELMSFNNRLPLKECNDRLKEWSNF